jgi:hypothetical protein
MKRQSGWSPPPHRGVVDGNVPGNVSKNETLAILEVS